MTIQNDAGELLHFIYNQYINDKDFIETKKVIETTKWDSGRINRSILYLKDLNVIKIELFCGDNEGIYSFLITGLTPNGIHMIENSTEFKRHFGYEINLAIFKFSWGKEER